jgi:hypothetical protein
MPFDLLLALVYRALALIVAAMMLWSLFRMRDWQQKTFAILVFVPFALRAAGIK